MRAGAFVMARLWGRSFRIAFLSSRDRGMPTRSTHPECYSIRAQAWPSSTMCTRLCRMDSGSRVHGRAQVSQIIQRLQLRGSGDQEPFQEQGRRQHSNMGWAIEGRPLEMICFGLRLAHTYLVVGSEPVRCFFFFFFSVRGCARRS